MAENYYDEVIRQITSCIEEGRYQKAMDMIQEELSMPYVPSDSLQKLNDLLLMVKPFLNREKPDVLLKPEQLLEYLRKGGASGQKALQSLQQGNIRNYLQAIQQYLDQPDADRILVSFLIEACALQQVNVPLRYHDLDGDHTVIPAQVTNALGSESFEDCWVLLEELFENENPSFLQQCHQILIQYTYVRYPEPLETDYHRLAYRIIRYLYQAYGDEDGWNRFALSQGIADEELEELVI